MGAVSRGQFEELFNELNLTPNIIPVDPPTPKMTGRQPENAGASWKPTRGQQNGRSWLTAGHGGGRVRVVSPKFQPHALCCNDPNINKRRSRCSLPACKLQHTRRKKTSVVPRTSLFGVAGTGTKCAIPRTETTPPRTISVKPIGASLTPCPM